MVNELCLSHSKWRNHFQAAGELILVKMDGPNTKTAARFPRRLPPASPLSSGNAIKWRIVSFLQKNSCFLEKNEKKEKASLGQARLLPFGTWNDLESRLVKSLFAVCCLSFASSTTLSHGACDACQSRSQQHHRGWLGHRSFSVTTVAEEETLVTALRVCNAG